jgi:hypothetical protein
MGRVVVALLILWIVVIFVLYAWVVAQAKQAPIALFKLENAL